jgi:acetamidase/formamidase
MAGSPGGRLTYAPGPDEWVYTLGGRLPVAGVRPGDTLTVRTPDCFGGAVRTPADLPSWVCTMPYVNPLAGPFLVEGAEPGDTLAVHLRSVEPARDWGVSATVPHFGALTGTATTATLQPALPEQVWIYELDRTARTVRFRARTGDYAADLPLVPMLGTVGVAPAGGQALSSVDCGPHGGNMDTPELVAGTTLYLGVNLHGGLLALGDGHARQGDGEACGVAVETTMTTTMTVDLIKGVPTPWPRIESDTAIMSVGCARPLEDAYRIGHHDLVRWVASLTGLEPLDAYQLVGQVGRAPIGNVCDPHYSVVAALDKAYLRGAVPYGGIHRRLREAP